MRTSISRRITLLPLLALLIWAIAPYARAGGPSLTGVTLSPGTASVVAGQGTTFALTGTFSDATTKDITEEASWTLNGGGFTGIPGQRGQFTATAQGSWTLVASAQGLAATATVTVTHGAPVSLNLLPKSATLNADGVLPLRIYGVDAHGNGFDVSHDVTLITTDPKGTVTADGYTPAVAGTWVITATLGNLTASTPVTITPGMLAALTITPSTLTTNIGDTAQLNAQGTDAKGNIVNAPIAWRVTNDDVGSVDTGGKFKAKSVGQTSVIASSGSVVAAAPVAVAEVNPSAATTPSSNDIIAVAKPTLTPKVAGEEVTKSEPEITAGQQTTAPAAATCKNIAHAFAIILLVAFIIVLGAYFTIMRKRHDAWWWIPPVALTAAMFIVYATRFCTSTYLWWPWTAIGVAIVFISVHYQRLEQPPPTPPPASP